MNSILQLLWRIPELQEEYVSKAEKLFETAPEDPYNDFITQARISGWPDWLKKDSNQFLVISVSNCSSFLI